MTSDLDALIIAKPFFDANKVLVNIVLMREHLFKFSSFLIIFIISLDVASSINRF